MDFYTSLNYSLGNEDWNVEKQALQIKPNDHVLCVTASGDRPLHLLMTEAEEIVSLDMNPSQTYLLELKLAACCQLDYETYLGFLGGRPMPDRLVVLKQLKPNLSTAAYRYWQKHKKMLANGVIFQGKTERLLRFASYFIKFFRNNKIKQLFEYDDLAAQRKFVDREWETPAWRKAFEVLFKPQIFKHLLQDPGISMYSEYNKHPGIYIHEKLAKYLQNHLAKDSPLLQLLLNGTLLHFDSFPYLTIQGYTKIRDQPERLKYDTGNIIQFLMDNPMPRFNSFSMSDIASYMPQVIFEKLLAGIKQSAHRDASFCLREFMSKRYIPETLTAHFKRNNALEKKLELEENNCVYRFMVGTIQH